MYNQSLYEIKLDSKNSLNFYLQWYVKQWSNWHSNKRNYRLKNLEV